MSRPKSHRATIRAASPGGSSRASSAGHWSRNPARIAGASILPVKWPDVAAGFSAAISTVPRAGRISAGRGRSPRRRRRDVAAQHDLAGRGPQAQPDAIPGGAPHRCSGGQPAMARAIGAHANTTPASLSTARVSVHNPRTHQRRPGALFRRIAGRRAFDDAYDPSAIGCRRPGNMWSNRSEQSTKRKPGPAGLGSPLITRISRARAGPPSGTLTKQENVSPGQ